MPFIWILLLWGAPLALGATLPSGLSSDEVDSLVGFIGHGMVSKLMRSAEPAESFPGLKLGVEMVLVNMEPIGTFGEKNGDVRGVQPIPRFLISKGLFSNLELTFSFLPSGILKTNSLYGAILKWAWLDERTHSAHVAFYGGYTRVRFFHDELIANDFELGAIASKDYVMIRPYMGLSGILAKGNVADRLASGKTAGSAVALHSFVGLEIQTPIALTAQFDLLNLTPSGSFLVGIAL